MSYAVVQPDGGITRTYDLIIPDYRPDGDSSPPCRWRGRGQRGSSLASNTSWGSLVPEFSSGSNLFTPRLVGSVASDTSDCSSKLPPVRGTEVQRSGIEIEGGWGEVIKSGWSPESGVVNAKARQETMGGAELSCREANLLKPVLGSRG